MSGMSGALRVVRRNEGKKMNPTKDFRRSTVKALAAKGIRIVSTVWLPGEGPMPFANGFTGYCLDDNGCGRIRSHCEVVDLANGAGQGL